MTRELIITGDDFGASSRVNEEMERLHQEGFLTQASLMVNGPALDEAIRILQRNPSLTAGLHLEVCTERPAWNGLRIFLSTSVQRQLARDIEQQVAAFRSLVPEPSYWDGHMHLHLHPTVFRLAFPAMQEAGFGGMRVVRERSFGNVIATVFSGLSARAEPVLHRAGMRHVHHTFGLVETGRITTRYARGVLEQLPPGLTEFYFHPGAEPEALHGRELAGLAAERGIRLRRLVESTE